MKSMPTDTQTGGEKLSVPSKSGRELLKVNNSLLTVVLHG
jgi:hypothetical protein